jgi:NADH-quinone oxidoreductase subunit J
MTTLFENIIVVLAGLMSVAGALGLLLNRDPVRAALGLLLSLSGVGFIFLTLGAHFLGFVQLIIYAGAIVILFLFAIMNFPLGRLKRDRAPITSLLGFVLVVVLLGILLADLSFLVKSTNLNLPFAARQYDDALRISRRLIFDWIYPFELAGVLLLAAIIAAVRLSGKSGDDNRSEEDDT